MTLRDTERPEGGDREDASVGAATGGVSETELARRRAMIARARAQSLAASSTADRAARDEAMRKSAEQARVFYSAAAERVQAAQETAAPAGSGEGVSTSVSEAELRRRRAMIACASAQALDASSPAAREIHCAITMQESEQRLASQREAAEREQAAQKAARERERPAHVRNYRPAHAFDPGPVHAAHERETQRAVAQRQRELQRATDDGAESRERVAAGATTATAHGKRRQARVAAKRRHRAWKKARARRVGGEVGALAEKLLDFNKDQVWTLERRHALAIRMMRNSAIIAHPARADAELLRLPPWTRAAILRALRGEGWTLADEAARRHLALWCFFEDFARPRAWQRPRKVESKGAPTRFVGFSRYALAVVGWVQNAIALAISGPAHVDAGADPVDAKTVQRHVALAEHYGAMQVVRRNPAAEPHLRGRPTESNPRGWAINEYWIPTPDFMKPGFIGAHFDAEGNPIGLEDALALELVPRAKRPRRVREAKAQQAQSQPPPTA